MEFIFEIIFQVIGDVLMQILLGFPFEWLRFNERKEHPYTFALSLSMFLGIIAGIISLFIFKEHIIANVFLRVTNLILGPIIIGKLFVKLHEMRNYKKDKLYLFSRFWNAYIFAASVAVIRFIFVQ